MRNKMGRNIIIIFALLITIILFSGCAVKETPKAPAPAAEATTVKNITNEVSSNIAAASEIVGEELKDINFTLVDENLK